MSVQSACKVSACSLTAVRLQQLQACLQACLQAIENLLMLVIWELNVKNKLDAYKVSMFVEKKDASMPHGIVGGIA